jgi:hypothetical protein
VEGVFATSAIFQLIAWRTSFTIQSIANLTSDCKSNFAELLGKENCPMFKVIKKLASTTEKIAATIANSIKEKPHLLFSNARG